MVHETMAERVRSVGDGIILGFPITETEVAGQSIDTVRLYFFTVSSETRYFQEYDNLTAIAAGGTTPAAGYGWLGDTGVNGGEDVLRVETDDWHLLHFGMGTNHPDLHVYYAVSPRANGDPALDRTGTDEDIVPGTDNRGWFFSGQIPDRFDPPAFTERVSFKNDTDGEFLQFAFENVGGGQLAGADLELLLTGGGYKVQPVTDTDLQNLMLVNALQRPEDPEIDTILHQVGGVNQYTLGTEEPDSWTSVRESDTPFTQDFNVQTLIEEQTEALVV